MWQTILPNVRRETQDLGARERCLRGPQGDIRAAEVAAMATKAFPGALAPWEERAEYITGALSGDSQAHAGCALHSFYSLRLLVIV